MLDKNSTKKSSQKNNPLNVGKSCDNAIKIKRNWTLQSFLLFQANPLTIPSLTLLTADPL